MKFNFKKVTAIAVGALVCGLTLGHASAISSSNTEGFDAVVYGSGTGVDPLDKTQADSIASFLGLDSSGSAIASGGEGVTEDEVVLGTQIDATGYDIVTNLTDSKIPALIDGKITWDDGEDSDDYDVFEQIEIGDMEIMTTLDDEDLDGVALSNKNGLSYKFYFEDALNCTGISSDNTITLTLLGMDMEFSDITATTVTVALASEMALKTGDTYTDPTTDKTVTITGIYSSSVGVDVDGTAKIVSESGGSETVNGVKIDVTDIGENTNNPDLSIAILKIGEEITKTYTDGDEFLGEDEDEPLWLWDITNACSANGYIGVTYNANIDDADDEWAGDTIKYVGESYILPNNFAAITLEGLTDVSYEDVTVSFTEADLYNSSDSGTANEDEEVMVISAQTTSSITLGSEETDTIYVWFADNSSATEGAINTYGSLEFFYRDHDGDNTPTGKARFESRLNLTAAGTLARTNFATIEVGDTTMDLDIVVASGVAHLIFEDPDDADINLTIGGVALANEAGTLIRFGATAEDADAGEYYVNGTDVSTKDYSIMSNYGIIASDVSGGPEKQLDSDLVTLSIPADQVYAIVSALGGISVETSESGTMVFTDSEKTSWQDKDVILVGGSCINSATATALGVATGTCGPDFTDKTQVNAGEFLIKTINSPFTTGKIAMIVAGYDAADTKAAATRIVNQGSTIDATVGVGYIGVTGTEGSSVITQI